MNFYVDTSVVGGLEDEEFAADSRALWQCFEAGKHRLVLSFHTLRELQQAPDAVRRHVRAVPEQHVIVLVESKEAEELARTYLRRGIVGPGSSSDALHVALATVGRVDAMVSWNFKHIVNLGRIRLFNAVNLELGYTLIEIRSPKEVIAYEE
jgi:hypothetical protein